MEKRDRTALAVMAERVAQRNRRETDGFSALIGSYQQIMSQLHYLSTQNQRMHTADIMGTTDKTIQMKDEQLMQLQKRIYDMEGVGKGMEKEMHGLREELNRQRLRAELAEQEAEDFRRRVRDLEHQLIEKSKMMMQELMLDPSNHPSLDNTSNNTTNTRHPPTSLVSSSSAADVTMLQHGKCIRAHATEVNSVCFSGSGKVAFTASSDGTVRAWDSFTCQAKADYRGLGMSQPLICVRVSEDGELVLGTGCDRICQVWRVGTGRIAHTLLGHKVWQYDIKNHIYI
ncbi:hypothetical protein H257_09945 [Aphanomyces astaci]|uniref:Uncharacterized protein n=1 Tax=Aphanomyces astaci TaxID=112090 RepID=W4G9N6_APHAT|nr:hypothetical protein H257_09945 [Aphanomyces astaci]ETV75991.1 hypothetical protein H257_09945 [Aphanomyces astaci]|eukprot:XP_009834633.1 hypothetical protein H257_09945 [Aphanomyces astaci]